MRYSVQNPYTSFTNYEPIHLISFKSFNRINDLELFQTHAFMYTVYWKTDIKRV